MQLLLVVGIALGPRLATAQWFNGYGYGYDSSYSDPYYNSYYQYQPTDYYYPSYDNNMYDSGYSNDNYNTCNYWDGSCDSGGGGWTSSSVKTGQTSSNRPAQSRRGPTYRPQYLNTPSSRYRPPASSNPRRPSAPAAPPASPAPSSPASPSTPPLKVFTKPGNTAPARR